MAAFATSNDGSITDILVATFIPVAAYAACGFTHSLDHFYFFAAAQAQASHERFPLLDVPLTPRRPSSIAHLPLTPFILSLSPMISSPLLFLPCHLAFSCGPTASGYPPPAAASCSRRPAMSSVQLYWAVRAVGSEAHDVLATPRHRLSACRHQGVSAT